MDLESRGDSSSTSSTMIILNDITNCNDNSNNNVPEERMSLQPQQEQQHPIRYGKMRSLSMPDVSELADIQAFNEALFATAATSDENLTTATITKSHNKGDNCASDSSSSAQSPVATTKETVTATLDTEILSPSVTASLKSNTMSSGSTQILQPLRLFSFGLHRSMSMMISPAAETIVTTMDKPQEQEQNDNPVEPAQDIVVEFETSQRKNNQKEQQQQQQPEEGSTAGEDFFMAPFDSDESSVCSNVSRESSSSSLSSMHATTSSTAGFLPKFYSQQKLKTLLPPPSSSSLNSLISNQSIPKMTTAPSPTRIPTTTPDSSLSTYEQSQPPPVIALEQNQQSQRQHINDKQLQHCGEPTRQGEHQKTSSQHNLEVSSRSQLPERIDHSTTSTIDSQQGKHIVSFLSKFFFGGIPSCTGTSDNNTIIDNPFEASPRSVTQFQDALQKRHHHQQLDRDNNTISGLDTTQHKIDLLNGIDKSSPRQQQSSHVSLDTTRHKIDLLSGVDKASPTKQESPNFSQSNEVPQRPSSFSSLSSPRRRYIFSGTGTVQGKQSSSSKTKPSDQPLLQCQNNNCNANSIEDCTEPNQILPSHCGDNSGGCSSSTAAAAEEDQPKEFSLLQHSDRAQSLPVQLLPATTVSSAKLLPRKSSLKRISSYHEGGKIVNSHTQLGNSGEHSSSSSSSSVDSQSMKRNVSFSSLKIREYNVALGDNPSCSFGPPITLGWDYRDTTDVLVEDYESKRSTYNPRRTRHQLVLSYNMRKYLLLKTAGYTKVELLKAMQEVERIKSQRRVTDMLLPVSKLDEVLEDVVDKVKGMMIPPKTPHSKTIGAAESCHRMAMKSC
eukprot:CAMPEP_0195306028 /NCGR_PEP_ID=MMETSP0707-20130614/36991_1 /TAXON_ID=33640 /ORGANISM="Asterionellopsis glacialis, Strain CCMP134" /LENGTH=838 /DNA_ID=CAMNT_0040370237 /DNA_START=142 /DNA_END=2658 /DNA_ORIENTATION=-